jgi:hypothetical protein
VAVPRSQPDPTVVASRIQAIGELRTARSHSVHLERVESTWEAPAGLQALPGASAVVAALTKNEALVSVVGQVDAGIDLRRARVEREGKEYVVVLPKAQVFRPSASGRLEHHKAGLFWRDEHLSLRGLDEGSARLAQSARESGLTARAEKEAESLIQSLAQKGGWGPVVVRFVAG